MEDNVICSRDKMDNSGDNNIILKSPFKMPLINTNQQNNQNIINNGIYQQQQVMDNQLLLTISSTPSAASSSSSNTTPSTSIQLKQNNKIDNNCCSINNVKNDSVFSGNKKQNNDDYMDVDYKIDDNDKELITSNNNCNNLEILNNNDVDEEDEDDIDIEEDDGYENDIDNCNDDDDDDDLSINSDNRIFYAYRGGGDIQEQPIRPREPSQDDETDFLEMDFDPDPSSENENFVLDNYPQQQQQQQQQQPPPLQQLEHEQLQVEIFQQIDQGQPQQQINHIESNSHLITNCQVQNIIQQNEQLRHNKKQTTKQLRKELEHQYDDIRIPREINQIAKVVQQNNNRILNNQQSQLDITSENSSSFIKLSDNNINLANKISKNTEFNSISNIKNTGTIPKQISVNKMTIKNESHINFLPCSSKQHHQQQQSSIKTYNYKDIDDSSNFMIENAITESLIYDKSSSDQYIKFTLNNNNNNDYVSKEYQQSDEICLDCNSEIKHYSSNIYDNKNKYKNPCKKCQSNEKLFNQQQQYRNNNNNKTKNIRKLENDEERNNDRKHFNKFQTKNIQNDNEFDLLINSTKSVSSLSSIQQCTDFITIYTHNCNETIIGDALTNFNILFNMEILKKRFQPLPINEVISMNIPEYMFYISRNNCNYHNIIKAIKESIINLDDLDNLQIDFIPLNDTSFSNASSSISTIYNNNSIMPTNANTTEERIHIDCIEIINRWNVNRNLKSILKFKNKSFCTENVLGKLVNIIRLYQKNHIMPTGFIEIPQYYESGYVRIARINKIISAPYKTTLLEKQIQI